MTTHRETVKLQDDGGIVIIREDILKGIERYVLARRAGREVFEYRGQNLELEVGIEKARREYFENISYLSIDANKREIAELRQTFLEYEKQINLMDGLGDDSGEDLYGGYP